LIKNFAKGGFRSASFLFVRKNFVLSVFPNLAVQKSRSFAVFLWHTIFEKIDLEKGA